MGRSPLQLYESDYSSVNFINGRETQNNNHYMFQQPIYKDERFNATSRALASGPMHEFNTLLDMRFHRNM